MSETRRPNHTVFKALALAALIVAISKCLRFQAWKMAGGPDSEHLHKQWHKLYGPKPPWFRGREAPPAEEPAQDEVATGAAPATA